MPDTNKNITEALDLLKSKRNSLITKSLGNNTKLVSIVKNMNPADQDIVLNEINTLKSRLSNVENFNSGIEAYSGDLVEQAVNKTLAVEQMINPSDPSELSIEDTVNVMAQHLVSTGVEKSIPVARCSVRSALKLKSVEA